MFEKEATEYALEWGDKTDGTYACCRDGYLAGAEFGYHKANEWHKQDYSLFDFVMKYENGKFKCEYKSGKVFESVDGETWKEIVLPKESK